MGIGPYGYIARGAGRAESPSHGFAVPVPFRQGDRGDGGTDCHSQCAHWLRNDRVFQGVRGKAGRRGYKRCGKTGRRGNRLASSATGGASPIFPPAGGVEPRPYGSATRGAMGGRPQGSPLRKRYKGGAGERGIPQSRLRCARPPLGKGAEETGENREFLTQ